MATGINLQPKVVNGLLTLDLSNRGLTSIPPQVFHLVDLEKLVLSKNYLTSIPAEIGALRKLQVLVADNNSLSYIHQSIVTLVNLGYLSFQRNQLAKLPNGLSNLRSLHGLFIRGNRFTKVPEEVCSLLNLQWLGVGDNPIRHLPGNIVQLTRLKILSITGCQFDEFPQQVLQLKSLEQLFMGSWAGEGRPAPVPENIARLKNLKVLTVDISGLESLPDGVEHLSALEDFRIHGNNFTTLPPQILKLRNIKKLNCSQNNISRLPVTLWRLTHLKEVDVSGNPLTYPPSDVCQKGTAAMLDFLKQEEQKQQKEKEDREIRASFARLSLSVTPPEVKRMARMLGLSKEEIQTIVHESPDDPGDQAYDMFLKWRETDRQKNTVDRLQVLLDELNTAETSRQRTNLQYDGPGGGYLTPRKPSGEGEAPGQDRRRSSGSVTSDDNLPIIDSGMLRGQDWIGQGGFASVCKSWHKEWRMNVAVKFISKLEMAASEQQLLYSEARKLKAASVSPYIIELYGVCLRPHFALVMSYMENGCLGSLLRHVDVPWALRWRMTYEISLAMNFLHCLDPQILHCDLKAANVLLDDDYHVKITDFGLSKWKSRSLVLTTVSPMGTTITHAPPEFLKDVSRLPDASFDVYSFGILIWEIMTRKQPFANVTHAEYIEMAVKMGQRPDLREVPTQPSDVTAMSKLMQDCWAERPHHRPSFKECSDWLRRGYERYKAYVRDAIASVERRRSRQRSHHPQAAVDMASKRSYTFKRKPTEGPVTLDLQGRKLSSIPDKVLKQKHIQCLILRDNKMKKISKKISKFEYLHTFDVSNNPDLKSIPKQIGSLPKLYNLHLENCGLESLPDELYNLHTLGSLNLKGNKLSALSNEISKLQSLKQLFIDNNQFMEFPEEICTLANLEVLGCGQNLLTRLPDKLTVLNLKSLTISCCQFHKFPMQVLSLGSLERLYMGGWAGSGTHSPIPEGIAHLQNLRLLAVDHSELASLPEGIVYLRMLQELDLSMNLFTAVPREVLALPSLISLFMVGNQVTRLPVELCRLPVLDEVVVFDNPLEYPPEDVCKEGSDAIIDFLRSEDVAVPLEGEMGGKSFS
ncbi:probable serine/threonine-protein kinase DDB_G0278509 [Branchiostoma lanceolatum]|uniref:probable serine/threonine-protein kinase DDB_G0278509 n=1 Tax=Branchiostoma lanceolatum TaxID=7740 RepID=UPI003452EC98